MQLRIGIEQAPSRELVIDLDGDAGVEHVREQIEAAVSGTERIVWFDDRHGRRVGVVADRINRVELDDDEH